MYLRHLAEPLRRALRNFPVLTLTGARQVGKSTLAQLLGAEMKARYLTLDDRATLDAALADPDGFISGIDSPAVLDEIQRAPDLLRAVKKAVDANRRPGRFFLTGSAHLTTLSSVAESLAGRTALFELMPLAWSEIARRKEPDIIDRLFESDGAKKLAAGLRSRVPAARRDEVTTRVLTGGFPTPVGMRDAEARRLWFESYRKTYIERDLRDLATIQDVPGFNRLVTLAALRSAQILNVSDLSRDAGLAATSTRRYLDLLQQTYQFQVIRPYFANAGKRLAKTPKIYATDTGLGCHLAGFDTWQALERQSRVGAWIETFVAGELSKLLAYNPGRGTLWTWRIEHGTEVDFVVERSAEVVGIEVKWASRVSADDLAGLRACRQTLGRRFRLGVLLYGGNETLVLDDSLVAVPFPVFFGRD